MDSESLWEGFVVSEKGGDSGTQSSQQFFASNYTRDIVDMMYTKLQDYESYLISKVLTQSTQ